MINVKTIAKNLGTQSYSLLLSSRQTKSYRFRQFLQDRQFRLLENWSYNLRKMGLISGGNDTLSKVCKSIRFMRKKPQTNRLLLEKLKSTADFNC